MGRKYTNYREGLKNLNLQSLEKRREELCLKFAKKCLSNEKVKNFFPIKNIKHNMKLRKNEKYFTRIARTKRLKNSAIPYMTNLLNKDNERKETLLKID